MDIIKIVIILSMTFVKILGVQVCGKALADMLDLVCGERGFHWIDTDALPVLSKRSAVQYLSQSSSANNPFHQPGIVSECCRNACTIHTMESYCAYPSGNHHVTPSNPLPQENVQPVAAEEPPTTTQRIPEVLTTQRPRNRFPTGTGNQRSSLYDMFRNQSRGNLFFFVRPVGPLPTRTPVVA